MDQCFFGGTIYPEPDNVYCVYIKKGDGHIHLFIMKNVFC